MNTWCKVLDIAVPSLESVRGHPDANTYALLLVALLERGGPMTLEEVATRFEEAGVAPAGHALRALKRCRPARPPVYRDGDLYELDPHSHELDLWALRLGLRPPRAPGPLALRADPAPLPGPEQPLTPQELDDAFRDAYVWSWSALRLAMAVLDAHGGRLPAERVLDTLNGLTTRHALRADSALHWRQRGVVVEGDGDWVLDPQHGSVPSRRAAVRKRVETTRRHRARVPDAGLMEAHRRRVEERRGAHAAELGALRRVVLYAAPFPGAAGPLAAVTLVDVAGGAATTWVGSQVQDVVPALDAFDVIAAMDVRPLLRSLGVDLADRRLDDLSPPQKSIQTHGGRRVVKITTEMLIRSSCGISRPLPAPGTLRSAVERGDEAAVRRLMEAGARALHALYRYGRLHGAVRLRRGPLDEMLGVPWVHRDETRLYGVMKEAVAGTGWIEAVLGPIPNHEDPWPSAVRCRVVQLPGSRWLGLRLDERWPVDERDVQLARPAEEPAARPGADLDLDPKFPMGALSTALRELAFREPWDRAAHARPHILQALRNHDLPKADRLLAIELAESVLVLDDVLVEELLRVASDPAEADADRAAAALALGPALAEADLVALAGDPGDATLSPRTLRRIQDAFRRLYHDGSVPPEVRRRVLEASVHADATWHEGAVRAALHSDDPSWRITGVFCAQHVQGFDREVLEALQSGDPALVLEAIHAAGARGLREAKGILSELAEESDREIADAALDALLDLEEDEALFGLDAPDDDGTRTFH